MIHFSRYTKLYILISTLIIALGLYSIARFGYRVSIDFTGGSQLRYATAKPVGEEIGQIAKVVSDHKSTLVDAAYTLNGGLILKLSQFDDTTEQALRTKLQVALQNELKLASLETVGPTIGIDSIRKTLYAAGLGVLVILGYIFYAFRKMSFAIAAVVALLHDILVVLGMYSIVSHYFGAQLDTLFVTALLTTMSFSVHDTIVIFDTIRDGLQKGRISDIAELSDYAVTSTLVRSLNNSLTIVFMLLSLVLLGGSSVTYFAVALLIGTVTGVYSSPFVATPVMIWLEKRMK